MKRLGALAIAALCSAAALPRDHVVLLTISNYPSRPLPGVRHDASNALRLADRLGFDTSGALVLKDSQLTRTGLRQAWAELAERVGINDRLFLYYSGHGASRLRGGQCESTLVSQDEALIDSDELKPHLDRIKSKLSEAIVLYDACHSGGLGESLASAASAAGMRGGLPDLAQPKSWTPRAGQRCDTPVNYLPSWLAGAGRTGRGVETNFLFVAAATEREGSLDLPQRGGLATISLLGCAESGVADADASGSISPAEWLACAQQRINDEVPRINQREGSRWLPHTLQAYGNLGRSLPLAPAPTPTPDTADPAGLAARVTAAFRAIEQGSNGRWEFDVSASRDALPLAAEFTISYRSSQPGYPYVLYVGSDQRAIAQLWPPLGEVRRLPAGAGRLPVRFQLEPPAGDNSLLVLVSHRPLDLRGVLDSGKTALSNARLQLLQCPVQPLQRPRFPGDPCASRNVSAREEPLGEVDGYAARVLRIRGLPN